MDEDISLKTTNRLSLDLLRHNTSCIVTLVVLQSKTSFGSRYLFGSKRDFPRPRPRPGGATRVPALKSDDAFG